MMFGSLIAEAVKLVDQAKAYEQAGEWGTARVYLKKAANRYRDAGLEGEADRLDERAN